MIEQKNENSAHRDILMREAAHWGAKMGDKIRSVEQRAIRHGSMEEYARGSYLNKLFAQPFIENKGALRVLELGFGSGGNAIRLARLGHRVTAIEACPEALQYAEQGARAYGVEDRIQFLHCDALEISEKFKAGQFDVVCGIGILHHLPGCLKSVLEKIRWLNPKVIVFKEAIGTNPIYFLIRKMLVGKSHSPDERALTHADLKEIARIFQGVRMVYGGAFIPYLVWKGELLSRADHLISNFGPLWRLAKTATIVWKNNCS